MTFYPTFKEYVTTFNFTPEEAIKILSKRGIRVIDPNIEINKRTKEEYRRIFSMHLKHQATVKSVSSLDSSLIFKSDSSTDGFKTKKKVPSFDLTKSGHDKEEAQKSLLSRDYIFLTQVALRRPALVDIIKQVLELRNTEQKDIKFVVSSEAVNQLEGAAATIPQLKKTTLVLKKLEENGLLTTLPGRVSDEHVSIGSYIETVCQPGTSILILGWNYSLHAFTYRWNKKHKEMDGYVPINERDITSNAYLVYPKNNPIFSDARDKPKTSLSDAPISRPLMTVPSTGDSIYYRGKKGALKPLKLGQIVTSGDSGTEAIVYEVEGGKKCVKVFKDLVYSELKLKKVELMCAQYPTLRRYNPCLMERIAWPETLVYNDESEPIGYMMALFKDVKKMSQFSVYSFPKFIPGGEKKHQIAMAISFLELICFVHAHNIILCDLNGGNLLFNPSQQLAYLVDLDSAQIADDEVYYPSNAGRNELFSPEHIGRGDYSFKRTTKDDMWIVQYFLFKLLTPFGDPYMTSLDVKKDDDRVTRGLYPYQSGENKAEEGIKGTIWHKTISHFPRNIKQMFWQAFHKEGQCFAEVNRKEARLWLLELVKYQEQLPGLVATDSESGKFFPNQHRKFNNKDTMSEIDELLQNSR